MSFLEIYNESIRDLLATTPRPATAKPLEVVGEDGVVKGLEERPVSMSSEVLSILREGDLRRRVGATDWNERSSRSHSVFVVVRIDPRGSDQKILTVIIRRRSSVSARTPTESLVSQNWCDSLAHRQSGVP